MKRTRKQISPSVLRAIEFVRGVQDRSWVIDWSVDWRLFALKQIHRLSGLSKYTLNYDYRDQLTEIAALAIATLESLERIENWKVKK